ncbi:MAG: MarR family transcriptional regulator [Nitrosopumilales archaeon]|nr:MAG: MarR family transcriptional regulator [Nitrosopumilales archaeon]
MNQEMVVSYRQDSIQEDGMLFVRTEGIPPTMIKAPIILAGLIIVTAAIPLQNSFSSTKALDLIIFQDGSTHVSSLIEVDPLEPDFTVNLFGNSIDNLVAIGENDFLLYTETIGSSALVETFGSSTISLDYDTHDLVSKEGRIWTFSIQAPSDYTLLMPQNSIIVGMSALPQNMELINEQTKFSFQNGSNEVNYILGTPTSSQPSSSEPLDNSLIFIGGAIASAGIIGAIFLRKFQRTSKKIETVQTQKISIETPDPETIFRLRPNLREDDKEIVNFIFNNGGQALESELRKKFLQPRTTMWRAVKRLERQGIIEIVKKDLQNLVKLKGGLEEEN